MEISMSQLGYMYSVATRQYQEISGDTTVTYSSSQTTINPSLDNVRSFISKGNYNLSIEERQKLMASYSDVLTKFVSENDVSDGQSDNNTTLDTNAVSDDKRTEMICGESIISDLTYGKHGREYLFSYDQTGMTVIDLRNGDEMWGLNFETPDQYNQVKDFLDTLNPEDMNSLIFLVKTIKDLLVGWEQALRRRILRLRILVRNHQTDLIMRSRAAIRRVHLHW